MAKTTIYLDKRTQKINGSYPIKLVLTHKSKSTMISLNVDILANQWDAINNKIVNHPKKSYLNNYINSRKTIADNIILNLELIGALDSMSIADLKKRIVNSANNDNSSDNNTTEERKSFLFNFQKFIEQKEKERTRSSYQQALKHITNFVGENKIHQLKFEDITKDWLLEFNRFLSATAPSQNARNIYLRNIRAVFNNAIDNEITSYYPFRKFKLKSTQTAKRSLSVEQLRDFFNAPCLDYQQQYLDMFKLTFYLIGINTIDLCHIKRIIDGRIEYNRAKTNRFYSIKVEPEAMEIINKYRGKNWLLDILDRYKNYLNYTQRLNKNLKEIGNSSEGRRNQKTHHPLYPDISIYWARHTWATIAAELDIPKETIAHALGHGGNSVTDIYIRFDDKKIDEANRKVIDYVLQK